MLAQTSFTHTQTLPRTHIIILFTGLDFGSRHSRAAFISVCLDTIYYQLFILVSVSSYLSGYGLTAAGFSDSFGVCVVWL